MLLGQCQTRQESHYTGVYLSLWIAVSRLPEPACAHIVVIHRFPTWIWSVGRLIADPPCQAAWGPPGGS